MFEHGLTQRDFECERGFIHHKDMFYFFGLYNDTKADLVNSGYRRIGRLWCKLRKSGQDKE